MRNHAVLLDSHNIICLHDLSNVMNEGTCIAFKKVFCKLQSRLTLN